MYVENQSNNEPKNDLQKDTSYATIIHLSSFAQFLIPFGGIIAPLILWLIKKDEDSFIDAHGKSCINFEISLLIYAFTLALLLIPITLFTLGIGLILIVLAAIPLFIAYVIVKIQAASQASKGEYYQYPFTIEILK